MLLEVKNEFFVCKLISWLRDMASFKRSTFTALFCVVRKSLSHPSCGGGLKFFFFSLRPPCRFQIEIPVSIPFLLLYFITINDTNCLLNFGYWRVCSNSYLSAGDGPQIPDFNFPILSKMNELAMLYFFIIYMKTPLLRIAPSLHPRIYWKYPQI